MTIRGSISRIKYYNSQNGYLIAFLTLDNESFQENENSLSTRSIVILGNIDREPQVGEQYEFIGNIVQNAKYGLQFKYTQFKRTEIKDEESLIKYLSSSVFEGIGQVSASKVIQKLGLDAIQKIKNDEKSLEGIGLTRKQIKVIYHGVLTDQINQEAMLFYFEGGLSIDIASRIINQLGPNNLEIVKDDPYILMDKIDYVGFKKNDEFALKIGIEANSPKRLKALFSYALNKELYDNGNSYIYYSDFIKVVNKYYGNHNILLTTDDFVKTISDLEKSKKIVLKKTDEPRNPLIFDYHLYYQEKSIALEIASLVMKKRGKTRIFSQALINDKYQYVANKLKITLSSKQQVAITSAFENDIMIITGGPGTGKTTIIKTILDIYKEILPRSVNFEESIALIAPTGRASKRLYETSGYQASTIHRYLGYDGAFFAYGKDCPRGEELVIVDEASMMDLPLFYQLLAALSLNARLIIVGDVDQLPSIGPGQILKDLIDTKEITVIKLDEIHRQSSDSSIIKLAHSVNEGELPTTLLEKKADRSFIVSPPEVILKNLLDVIKISIAKGYDIQKDIQILIPMYNGQVGINNVNSALQEFLNPHQELKYFEYLKNSKLFRKNDKIIQLVNRPEKNIMNGDIGYISSFIVEEGKITGLMANYDGNYVEYSEEEFDDISLAYAITIHKAQGSEFKVVILPISSGHYIMLKRKLLYTAITRAKQKLIMLGEPNTLYFGVKRVEENRLTILKDEIIKNIKGKITTQPKKVLTEDTENFVYQKPLSELDIDEMNIVDISGGLLDPFATESEIVDVIDDENPNSEIDEIIFGDLSGIEVDENGDVITETVDDDDTTIGEDIFDDDFDLDKF